MVIITIRFRLNPTNNETRATTWLAQPWGKKFWKFLLLRWLSLPPFSFVDELAPWCVSPPPLKSDVERKTLFPFVGDFEEEDGIPISEVADQPQKIYLQKCWQVPLPPFFFEFHMSWCTHSLPARSLVTRYVLGPFWNWFITLWPLSVAPNTVRPVILPCFFFSMLQRGLKITNDQDHAHGSWHSARQLSDAPLLRSALPHQQRRREWDGCWSASVDLFYVRHFFREW